jgi:hypothetical protein
MSDLSPESFLQENATSRPENLRIQLLSCPQSAGIINGLGILHGRRRNVRLESGMCTKADSPPTTLALDSGGAVLPRNWRVGRVERRPLAAAGYEDDNTACWKAMVQIRRPIRTGIRSRARAFPTVRDLSEQVVAIRQNRCSRSPDGGEIQGVPLRCALPVFGEPRFRSPQDGRGRLRALRYWPKANRRG